MDISCEYADSQADSKFKLNFKIFDFLNFFKIGLLYLILND